MLQRQSELGYTVYHRLSIDPPFYLPARHPPLRICPKGFSRMHTLKANEHQDWPHSEKTILHSKWVHFGMSIHSPGHLVIILLSARPAMRKQMPPHSRSFGEIDTASPNGSGWYRAQKKRRNKRPFRSRSTGGNLGLQILHLSSKPRGTHFVYNLLQPSLSAGFRNHTPGNKGSKPWSTESVRKLDYESVEKTRVMKISRTMIDSL